jgi:hypothetical protein
MQQDFKQETPEALFAGLPGLIGQGQDSPTLVRQEKAGPALRVSEHAEHINALCWRAPFRQ